MLNLLELEQLAAFDECGTLSGAAEKLHISQPTLTRTMKHIEEEFGVDLFVRGKNKITLNETGKKAAEYAKKLINEAENAVSQVRAFSQSLRTISVESCAPVPLWLLPPALSEMFPDKIISSKLSLIDEIIKNVISGSCQIGILPYAVSNNLFMCSPFIREELSVCLPKEHFLAKHESLSFSDINGFNCLLKSQIGFWNEMCREKMPASKFLVQTDDFEFDELVKSSTLPCFVTNLVNNMDDILKNRVIIPISDSEANVNYHLIYLQKNKDLIKAAEKVSLKNDVSLINN